MKKAVALLLVTAMLAGMTACGAAPAPAAAPAEAPAAETEAEAPAEEATEAEAPAAEGKTPLHIGYSINALDAAQTAYLEYYQAWWENESNYDVEWSITNAEGDAAKQIADVESLIALGVDLIMISPTDIDSIVTAEEAANAAGIPVCDVNFNAETDAAFHVVNEQTIPGNLQGQFCLDWLEEHPDETLKVGYMWGKMGVKSPQQRHDGFVDVLAQAGDRAEVIAEKVCDWQASKALDTMEDWIQAYPEMNCVVTANDEMSLAASQVVQAAGKQDQIIVIGLDGLTDGQAAVKDGTLIGTVYFSIQATAEKGMGAVQDYYEGKYQNGDSCDISEGTCFFITAENIDEIIAEHP